ncbi:SLC13 family permease [Sedimenticola selenatireducens]|uniref:SLC13 family permease n=1 Tax=Sedimenticola selenatireducens TaxID=191960 RepID=A0A557SDI6_9GAMM|nr:SLC13 family permease [Sedimenticola selenatireducens]TVO75478.1 SLC13 family permease [Sedimenticola selenatireducens]TVT65384.1 MAG: SLC13 family permease [Sedimenticola selenatireducens]
MEFPALPDAHGLAVLLLVVVALALFTRERVPLETSSLVVLVLLTTGFEVFPYVSDGIQLHAIDFFRGFGHEALVAVCALMIAGQGLVRTGALEPVGRQLARLWSVSPMLSLLLTLLVGAFLSAFVNNVPIVVLLLPILISVSLRNNRPASEILMPMGFATLVGGMSTTIGTSTNLLVVSVAADMGLPRFSMFHFFVPAAIAGGLAILFLWLVAPRMLPKREALMEDISPRVFNAQLNVEEESFAAGKTLAEVNEAAGRTLKISQIHRGEGVVLTPFPDVILKPGDRLSLKDTPDNLKEMEAVLGAKLYIGDIRVDEDHPLADEDQQLAEIVVTQGSPLDGTTLSRLRFADYYQLVTLALHRAGAEVRTLKKEVGDVPLEVSDVLLVQGRREHIAELKRSGELLVLDATSDLPTTKRASLALLIMAAIVITAAFGLLPIAISATCGVLLMITTRCLSWRDAAQALNTQVILIVVASLAMGMALSKTGGAEYLAQLFVGVSAGSSPTVMLSGLMLVMAILTNIVSNNAAAVIGTPIAIDIAQQLGLPAEPFVLAVLFGANMSYATPMAYKTNLLVMNAGGYQFNDFVRVGIPLTLIVWLTLSWLLPMMYQI